MKRLLIVGGILYTIVTVALTIFVLEPAKPIIDIRGEKLIHVTDFGTNNEILTFNITNTLFTAWVVMALLLLVSFIALRGKAMIPSGFYNFFESIIELIYNFVVSIVGEQYGRRFFPLVATLFIYIALANWLSLTPIFNTFGIFEPVSAEPEEFQKNAVVFKDTGGVSLIMPGAEDITIDTSACQGIEDEHQVQLCQEEEVQKATEGKVGSDEKIGVLAPFLRGINTDLMTPLSFALVAMFVIQYWGITTLGFRRYMGKFINFHSPIDFFVGFLESVAEFAKIISFSFRLFGNMLAGEILLLVMTFLVAVSSPLLVIFYGLEVFVGGIQAFVFGTLTLVFALSAVSHHGPEAHEEGGNH